MKYNVVVLCTITVIYNPYIRKFPRTCCFPWFISSTIVIYLTCQVYSYASHSHSKLICPKKHVSTRTTFLPVVIAHTPCVRTGLLLIIKDKRCDVLIRKRRLRNEVWRQSSHKTLVAERSVRGHRAARSHFVLCRVSGGTGTMTTEKQSVQVCGSWRGGCFLWIYFFSFLGAGIKLPAGCAYCATISAEGIVCRRQCPAQLSRTSPASLAS